MSTIPEIIQPPKRLVRGLVVALDSGNTAAIEAAIVALDLDGIVEEAVEDSTSVVIYGPFVLEEIEAAYSKAHEYAKAAPEIDYAIAVETAALERRAELRRMLIADMLKDVQARAYVLDAALSLVRRLPGLLAGSRVLVERCYSCPAPFVFNPASVEASLQIVEEGVEPVCPSCFQSNREASADPDF